MVFKWPPPVALVVLAIGGATFVHVVLSLERWRVMLWPLSDFPPEVRFPRTAKF
ncbi:MAG: hypothetical protein ABSB81_09770 [Halobacteriota archaeon]|jgi:hypothetical protein